MNPINQREQKGRSTSRWFKEVYYSVFVLLFRLSRWKGPMRILTASMGVSVLIGMLGVTIWSVVKIATHQHARMSWWVAVVVLGPLFAANHYFLVARGGGTEFEKQFRTFARNKQVGLYFAAILIVIGSVAGLFASIIEYHHFLGGS